MEDLDLAIKFLSAWAECNYEPTKRAAKIALNVILAQKKAEENPRLTIEELREMDGQPVWCSNCDVLSWGIIHKKSEDNEESHDRVYFTHIDEGRVCTYDLEIMSLILYRHPTKEYREYIRYGEDKSGI